jgi:uncharacterized SAM-binding protein YcdF (DUF218 family)
VALCIGFMIIVSEIMVFEWVRRYPLEKNLTYDAIVVFAGSNNRIERAFQLARKGVAPAVIVSPAGRRTLAYYEKQFGRPGKAKYILERRADTTYMNAYYAAQLIRKHSLKSVLLVTSDYHMARSFVLLKLTTFGSGCSIGMHKVVTRFSKKDDSRLGAMDRIKLTYNEMLQLWGSLGEGVLHTMKKPQRRLKLKTSTFARWLRDHLLFEVECADCR